MAIDGRDLVSLALGRTVRGLVDRSDLGDLPAGARTDIRRSLLRGTAVADPGLARRALVEGERVRVWVGAWETRLRRPGAAVSLLAAGVLALLLTGYGWMTGSAVAAAGGVLVVLPVLAVTAHRVRLGRLRSAVAGSIEANGRLVAGHGAPGRLPPTSGRRPARAQAAHGWTVLQLVVGAVMAVVGAASLPVRPSWWAVADIGFGLWFAVPAARRLATRRRGP